MDLSFSFRMNDLKSTSLQQDKVYDFLAIGAGPAGLNAALYGKRKGLDVAVISKKKGGQIVDTSVVDNYLGIYGLTGEALAGKFLSHLTDLEVPVLENTEVVDYFSQGLLHNVVLSTGEIYQAKALLLATGSRPRLLSVPGESKFFGEGVSYCAICDGPLFKGGDVFVAGGGNSAVEAALDLAKLANSVTIVHRSEFRADKILVDKLVAHPKIKIFLQTKITEIVGEARMTGLLVENLKTGENQVLMGSGIFIEIGNIPNTAPFDKLLKLNERGEIITNTKKETNIPGIFAAGDVTDSLYKQIIISAGDGAIAALAINEYINQTEF
ncbi:MAG: FAD-dependent oxidoreductase [Bacillota bacterium]